MQPVKALSEAQLFQYTGKFDHLAAMAVVKKATRSFMLALRDHGGRWLNDPSMDSQMALALGLMNAEAYSVVRETIVRLDWVALQDCSDGVYLVMTEKGQQKTQEFAVTLPAEEQDTDAEEDA